MIFEALGILEYSSVTFCVWAYWGMSGFDVRLEERPFIE
jgi:hypothetical protein